MWQLFVEVLVLEGGAAVVALVLVRLAFDAVLLSGDSLFGDVAFWVDTSRLSILGSPRWSES